VSRSDIGSARRAGGAVAVLLAASLGFAMASSARAQDFLSTLFGAFGAGPPLAPQVRPPFPNDQIPYHDAPRGPAVGAVIQGGEQAYCVRGCDGRYFPVQGSDRESEAQSCKSFCPASETTMVYGSGIDDATTENGKPYSELPNAFRYRNEIVAGCTCNGKDQVGLAPVKIRDDPTLRRGDIVAGAGGLLVANRSASGRHGAAVNFSPLPDSLRARLRHIPVVARQ